MIETLMIKYRIGFLALLFALSSVQNAYAENISKANELLCASVSVVVCASDGDCVSALPWELNVPNFINIDLKKQRMSTTKASGENRQTEFDQVKREAGLIFLQGVEAGRAFSFVIAEDTGIATIAVAREELSVTVFGSCTPAAY